MGTDSGAARTLLDGAATLHLHTGNLMNWGRLKKKCAVSPSEELGDCIRTTLNEWSLKVGPELVQESPNTLECAMTLALETINPEERDEMKVSVKLFVLGDGLSSIRHAVDMACSTLAVTQLDSVIIAPPPLEDGVTLTLEHLQPYWRELESLVQDNKVVAIGTSDLDKPLLEQLYLWAQIKPSSNQVNLASCCIMPPDLTAFAKQLDIQLLTHSDSKEILSEESFQDALKEGIQGAQVDGWSPEWVLRYSVIVKTRGIIKSKGYIIQAQRKAPH
ncbi:glutamate--cysteine ligase regulatory subunit [Ranitomeya imitator]|uniref:glutamate--cysteine ligase regulatory subunit n=1 Tax=Ranitomeya imitator TaxID=111125 RepID=UPI001AA36C38